ncbi:adaptin ear-binding coat-associated protein-like protein 1 [Viridothelium virens]|uniref:Adaptin ear-binding coat-associated protein-like protein 1 n=1 Tax=Viridothelium virens TaxID=1048519 RepID=A0A6A6HQF8_VIRVR|nr:adaptin ear-binding coat-associated protein-like protein 1 [Viridothelium virens]
MATPVDPTTSLPLPQDSIQRILHVTSAVHVYAIPPLTTTKGYSASSWTHPSAPTAQQIFTAGLRVMETAIPNPASPTGENVKTDILLEDPKTGELFAAAPYTTPATVEQANDSSRFFALRVIGEGGRKATLGLGFEERSEALDFGIALQEARKVLGMEGGAVGREIGAGAAGKVGKDAVMRVKAKEAEKKDWSLKEGETITVNIGEKGRRNGRAETEKKDSETLFSLKPPAPGGSGSSMPFLPPPPSASDVKAERSRSRSRGVTPEKEKTPAQEMGFDDGEFGEFQ